MSIKTILVPYDFSDCATDALCVAGKIARLTGACIDVVHVYEQVEGSITDNVKVREAIEARMEQVPDLPFLEGVELKKFVLRQIGLTDIFKNPHLNKADLVVMGSHGTRGLAGELVGSNTQRVVRVSPMPVLTIKQRIEDFAPRDIVFASNFSTQDVERFESFRPFVDLFDANVHLVKVITAKTFERSEDSHRAIDAFLQRHELRKFTATIYNDLSIEAGILNFARGIDADLITMATHGRTGFFHVVNGSLTEDIVNHTSIPVLSAKL